MTTLEGTTFGLLILVSVVFVLHVVAVLWALNEARTRSASRVAAIAE